MDVDVRVVEDPGAEVAQVLVASSGAHVALSGGSTPAAAYRRAARTRPDWSGVHLWFADERCVPPGDPRSNYRLARETMFDELSRPPEVHRIRGELDAEEAAGRLDAELQGVTLDLVVLGIGVDGHTASLFPHAPALQERQRRAVAAEAGLEPFVPRVTMTLPVPNAARLMVFLVTGADKADAVARAFGSEPDESTPASLARGVETVVVLDADAARQLRPAV